VEEEKVTAPSRVLAALAAGVGVYVGLSLLTAFPMSDVFEVSNAQADLKDLVIELVPYVVPTAGAVLAALFVGGKLRGKRGNGRGFGVTRQSRDGGGPA
jgi:hypothetical protein